jgi:hypothetical protein
VAGFWKDPEVVKDSRDVGNRCNKNRIPVREVTFQILDETPKVLLLGGVVSREEEKVGADKKQGEEKLQMIR